MRRGEGCGLNVLPRHAGAFPTILAGGPGGSELPVTRTWLGALEDHFMVVNWNQPGCGKSYHAMISLVERYYDVLQAPHKELIWFDKSGHTPIQFEPNKVVDVLVNRVLAQTYHKLGLAQTRKGA